MYGESRRGVLSTTICATVTLARALSGPRSPHNAYLFLNSGAVARRTRCEEQYNVYVSNDSSALILRAAAFAAHKHRGQPRKDKAATPYINHPIAVACLLSDEAGITDPVVLAAALLHDTIEDTETTHEELVAAFGAAIGNVVAEVTDDKSLLKEDRKRLQVERAAYLSHKAKLVKIADKICNLRDIVYSPPDWTIERNRKYFEWARQVVDQMQGAHQILELLFDSAHSHEISFHPNDCNFIEG